MFSLLMPSICPFCEEELFEDLARYGQNCCQICYDKLENPFKKYCQKCGLPVGDESNATDCITCRGYKIYYDSLYFLNEYNAILHEYIIKFKYQKDLLLGMILSKMLTNKLDLTNHQSLKVVSVPMYRWKKWQRGFNPAEIIAYHVAKKFHLSYSPKILQRKIKGDKQAGQAKTSRRANVKGLYSLAKPKIEGSFLLVDDVITTGSTINECAKLLKNAGAKQVICLALAGVHKFR